nr:MAG TPA: repressor domain protein [Caudoviricetes sp.]
MTNQIQFSAFTFKSNSVRVITDNKQEPWFCANDVCDILGYSNPRDAISKHCKVGGVAKRDTPTKSAVQEMTFINEPNLYRLIIKSRKPEAEPFEAWVFEEVLPQIRKTGKYEIQLPEPEPTINIELTVNEWRNLVNVWALFTRYEDSVSFLLKSVAPFIHGHPFSSAQFNHSRAKPALIETVPTIKKIMEKLPKAVKFHESREQISHKYGF